VASACLPEALIVNGDTLFDIDIPLFLKFAKDKDATACIALRKVDNCSRYGRISVTASGEMIAFGEKGYDGAGLINGGIYYLRSSALDALTSKKFSFETDFLSLKHSDQSVYGLPFDDYFIDIGIPTDLQRAQSELQDLEQP
jgi:D-glycero-alpha-D-manno-heptose 1-phosphate guanylyltransferase